MNEVEIAKAKYRQQHWEKLIRECQKSGKTIAVWCNEAGVKESSYYYWLQKIRRQACSELQKDCIVPEIVPVNIKGVCCRNEGTAAILRLNDLVMEIRNGADEETIRTLMRIFGKQC